MRCGGVREAGAKAPAVHVPPHFFGLAQRNGSGTPKKNAPVRIGAFFACSYRFSNIKRGHPVVECVFCIAVRALLRFARGTTLQIINPSAARAKRSQPRSPDCVWRHLPAARFTERVPSTRRAAQIPAAVGRLWSLRGFFWQDQKKSLRNGSQGRTSLHPARWAFIYPPQRRGYPYRPGRRRSWRRRGFPGSARGPRGRRGCARSLRCGSRRWGRAGRASAR